MNETPETVRAFWPRLGRMPALALVASGTWLPIVFFNADFASTPFEWLELVSIPLLFCGACAGLGAAIAVLRGGRAVRGGEFGALVATLASLALTGMIVSGPGLAASGVLIALGLAWIPSRLLAHARTAGSPLWAGGTMGALWVLCLFAHLTSESHTPERQLLMIGLDGASWDLIDHVRMAGRAPTFDRLIENGVRGELDVMGPLVSPALWTSIASGHPARVHGIRDFETTSHDVRVKRLWEIASDHEVTSGVFGYLVTWPPTTNLLFMVPGFLAHDFQTHPPGLEFIKRVEVLEKERSEIGVSELMQFGLQALRSGMSLASLNSIALGAIDLQSPGERAVRQRLSMISLRTDLFCGQLRRTGPEFAIFYHRQIDAVGHLFFKYFSPEGFPGVTQQEIAELGDVLPIIYQATDDALDRILGCAHPDADVIIVSDHGQRPARRAGGEDFLIIKTSKLLEALDLQDEILATNVGRYVNLRPADAASDWRGALERLARVRRSSDTAPVLELIMSREDSASMTASAAAMPPQPIVVGERVLRHQVIFEPVGRVSGEHTRSAILLAAGPHIAVGSKLPRSSLLDVAPTVLSLLGLPIGRDMPGRVIRKLYHPDARSRRTDTFVDSHGAPARTMSDEKPEALPQHVRERLRELGYIE